MIYKQDICYSIEHSENFISFQVSQSKIKSHFLMLSILLYVLVMSCTRLRVNPHSIVA